MTILSDVLYKIEDDKQTLLEIFCPGCGYCHPFRTRGPGPVWSFDGNVKAPTFSPSMLVNKHDPESRCHSFVERGQIRFLTDCHHDLAGKTVPLPPLPDWMRD